MGRGIGWPYAAGTDQGIDVFSASKPSKIRHIWRRGSPSSRIEIIRVLVAITTNHQPFLQNAARPSISLLAGSLNCAAAFTIASFWSVALTSPTHRALAPAQRIVHAGSGGGAAVPAEAGVLPWRDHRTVAVTSESPFASGSRPRRRRASKDAALAFMRKHVGSPSGCWDRCQGLFERGLTLVPRAMAFGRMAKNFLRSRWKTGWKLCKTSKPPPPHRAFFFCRHHTVAAKIRPHSLEFGIVRRAP